MRRQLLPVAIAITTGIVVLLGLLLAATNVTNVFLGWAAFLAAVALVLGVVNLFSVHINRFLAKRNVYSGALVLSMLTVFGLALTDRFGITENGLRFVFTWVQAPLEAALASLLAFFLLFAAFRLLKRNRTIWSVLFLVTAVTLLVSNALAVISFLPSSIQTIFAQIQQFVSGIFVTAGMRGVLIGVALGTIMLSIRILAGVERPYNK